MFNVGGGEVLVILVLVLVVLGPDKLPSAARTFGKHLGDFRRISGGFREEIANAMNLDSSAPAPPTDPAPVAASAPTRSAAPPTTAVATATSSAVADASATSVAEAAPRRPAPSAPIDPSIDDELVAVRSEGPVESFA